MTQSHRPAAWDWDLDGSRAELIDAEPRTRWLAVIEGRAWLTRTGAGPHGADLWLDAGERAPLPAGSEWVIEGWPAARVQLLEERPARRARHAAAGWRAWLGALLGPRAPGTPGTGLVV